MMVRYSVIPKRSLPINSGHIVAFIKCRSYKYSIRLQTRPRWRVFSSLLLTLPLLLALLHTLFPFRLLLSSLLLRRRRFGGFGAPLLNLSADLRSALSNPIIKSHFVFRIRFALLNLHLCIYQRAHETEVSSLIVTFQ